MTRLQTQEKSRTTRLSRGGRGWRWRIEKEHLHCLLAFVHPSIHSLYRIDPDRDGLGWAELGWRRVQAHVEPVIRQVNNRQGPEEIIDRWAILPHAFQGSVVTRGSGASETSPEEHSDKSHGGRAWLVANRRYEQGVRQVWTGPFFGLCFSRAGAWQSRPLGSPCCHSVLTDNCAPSVNVCTQLQLCLPSLSFFSGREPSPHHLVFHSHWL